MRAFVPSVTRGRTLARAYAVSELRAVTLASVDEPFILRIQTQEEHEYGSVHFERASSQQ
ncbi:MAG: hypothetical protein CM15mP74_17320 [Halieaceae bacterium]|nr:MAG: hypothetical protein CM15mP74_17320 [Halieaceae bacterium]